MSNQIAQQIFQQIERIKRDLCGHNEKEKYIKGGLFFIILIIIAYVVYNYLTDHYSDEVKDVVDVDIDEVVKPNSNSDNLAKINSNSGNLANIQYNSNLIKKLVHDIDVVHKVSNEVPKKVKPVKKVIKPVKKDDKKSPYDFCWFKERSNDENCYLF